MLPLTELLARANMANVAVTGDSNVAISSVVTDSRAMEKNALFIAIPGVTADGTQYVPDALKKGAAALLLPQKTKSDVIATVPVIRVADVRAAVSALAAAFYPEQPRYCLAVTGTDGKTSTADFVRQMASLLGHKAASMGTLGLRSPDAQMNAAFPPNNTSPEPVLLHKTLQQLSKSGVEYISIEASSHGLDQKRLDGLKLTAAAFTNLTRDHLDYHGTLENYFAAKARLFDTLLPEQGTAIINADDPYVAQLQDIAKQRKLQFKTFGKSGADYRIVSLTPHAGGLDAVLHLEGSEAHVSLPLYGAFQLYNILAAYGLLRATGIAQNDLLPLFAKLQGVRGRLERAAMHPNGAPIFVDYAHTPAALENILKTLRHHTAKKLNVVFGCGGDRDAGKRPEMGKAASQFADHVIVTDDNPRSENPDAIRAAIMAAAKGATEIGDRKQAIAHAVKNLQEGDVLVVAGKGHETTQIVGGQTHHFDDAEEIQNAVRAL
ncbi:MAG: UDP-N-acetylmuramoyl-L-alanyl-D-glutamate--2,6-diaminopimelate ligase [Alphaproteobacteria bacterium]|nr:UDP-N-acetylmuramoyl-L-alanyl-D-glutamate--2,6-diaminopimelate ligase [Alphaproteobacteria bacterium]